MQNRMRVQIARESWQFGSADGDKLVHIWRTLEKQQKFTGGKVLPYQQAG